MIVSPGHAKRIWRALGENIARYESQFGAIKESPAGNDPTRPLASFNRGRSLYCQPCSIANRTVSLDVTNLAIPSCAPVPFPTINWIHYVAQVIAELPLPS